MSTCNTSAAIHSFSLPKPLEIHQKSNPNKHKTHLRRRTAGIKCCNAKREHEAKPKDYYQVLGVSVHSTPRQIKEAYRSLQKKHHPDVAGQRGHEYTIMLNEAYRALMREDSRTRFDASRERKREGFESNFSGLGRSSWKGPLRPQALFVDENKCIGCRECVHHASETFAMDEALGCARVKVQFGDHDQNIEVSVDSCPVNCIHWVESEELPVLEFLVRPQPKEAKGVFGGGWERPADIFAAAKYFKKQLNQQRQHNQDHSGQANMDDETPGQAKARYHAGLKLQLERFLGMLGWSREHFGKKN